MNKDIYRIIGASNHSKGEREINDFYSTNPAAIDALFEVESFTTNIFEPAAGNGHLSERLKEHHCNVYSSDLIQRDYHLDRVEDFLTIKKMPLEDMDVVTNPPYNLAMEFVYKALELLPEGYKCAMFLKLQFLETQKRRKLFDIYPPKHIYVFSKRMGCLKGAKLDDEIKPGAMAFAWYVWEKGWKGETILSWI